MNWDHKQLPLHQLTVGLSHIWSTLLVGKTCNIRSHNSEVRIFPEGCIISLLFIPTDQLIIQRLIMVAELHVVYELQSAALFSLSVIGSM